MTDPLPRCRLTTWADAERWADAVAEQVRVVDRLPETIVGLTRGGWVPARMLADRLGVRRLVAVRAQHWGVTATRDGKAELTEPLTASVEGQTVLVADDITDTGESLRLARAHVAERGPKRLETATFLHIGTSTVRPDYVGEEIPKDRWVWVVFPWNYWEDLRALAMRIQPRATEPAEVQQILATESGLTVPLPDLRAVLR